MEIPPAIVSKFEYIMLIIGTAEASPLEPFESISDWLLSGPDIDWQLQLMDASRSSLYSSISSDKEATLLLQDAI